ncbi:hypothetical protein PVAP13_2KG166132 [Panicum virgatum]|uniref:Uncharacterized protein n=1 Tax=Panicum virgatum TaxID=38727 RepID=A0A8T0W1C7_PANVG|nr:hypothetical protein PVAP13_2KG166132 [Panicum virgatum]
MPVPCVRVAAALRTWSTRAPHARARHFLFPHTPAPRHGCRLPVLSARPPRMGTRPSNPSLTMATVARTCRAAISLATARLPTLSAPPRAWNAGPPARVSPPSLVTSVTSATAARTCREPMPSPARARPTRPHAHRPATLTSPATPSAMPCTHAHFGHTGSGPATPDPAPADGQVPLVNGERENRPAGPACKGESEREKMGHGPIQRTEPARRAVDQAGPRSRAKLLGPTRAGLFLFQPSKPSRHSLFPFYPADMRVPRVSLRVRLTGGTTDMWTTLTWTLTVDWSMLTSQR